MYNHRVLVIDDEPQMIQIVSYALELEGLDVMSATTAHKGWQLFSENHCDLIILDVMLPDASGYALCQRIRASNSGDVPIIMLTALGETDNRVEGLEAGADDYLAKPFSPKELVLRSLAVLRRSSGLPRPATHEIIYGPVTINSANHEVFIDGRKIDTTATEGRLLQALVSHPNEVVSVKQLLNEVWNTTATQGGRNMVKSTAYRLRKKLENAGLAADSITAVRGQGYVFQREQTIK